jgi:hypothetical protein
MSQLGLIVAGSIGPFGGVKLPKARRQFGPATPLSGVETTTTVQQGAQQSGVPVETATPVPVAQIKAQGQPGVIVAQITESERHVDELRITDHPVESGAPITDHAFKMPVEVTIRCSWSNSPPQSNNSSFGGFQGNLASGLGNYAAGTVQAQLTSAGAKVIGGSAIGNLALGQLSDVFGQQIVSVGSAGLVPALVSAAQGGGFSSGNGAGGLTRVESYYQQLLDLQNNCIPIDVYTGKRRYTSMLIKSLTVETDIKTENSLSVVLVLKQAIIVYTTLQAINTPASAQAAPENVNANQQTGTVNPTPVNVPPNSALDNAVSTAEGSSYVFNPQIDVTTVFAEGTTAEGFYNDGPPIGNPPFAP